MAKKKNRIWPIIQKHLMTATGYMIPFVVAGGVIFALSVMMTGKAASPTPANGWVYQISLIGQAGLKLFIPALGGYLAFSMGGRPGIAPGFITSYLAVNAHCGFIGGIVGGLLAGWTVMLLKKIPIKDQYKTLGSIFLYPLVGTLIPSCIILFIIGSPIAAFMTWLTAWLKGMSGSARGVLGAIMGAMIGVDMGGPINKVACTFAQTQVNTLPFLMGIMGPAVCTPPIGLGVATLIFRNKFSPAERDSGLAAILMGCCGITEGAIPFATADPLRVIPANTIGSLVAGVVAAITGAVNHAPWGGLIVLPVVGHIWGYLLAVVIGSAVTACIVGFTKKKYHADQDKPEQQKDLDLNITTF